MKKHLFLIGFLLQLTFATAQNGKYIPFPSNMIVYNHEYRAVYDGGWYSLSRFEIQGDTLINGLHYSKYYLGSDNKFGSAPGPSSLLLKKQTRLAGAIRNDSPSKKVYLYLFKTKAEEVLYDFDLQVGDTLFINNGFKFYRSLLDDQLNAIIDTVIVSRIDSILMPHDNLYHKRFHFTAKYHENYGHWPGVSITSDSLCRIPGAEVKINPLIEGVGFVHNPITLLHRFEQYYSSQLICSSINNKTIFEYSSIPPNPSLTDDNCNSFITSIDNKKDNASALKLYPNPSNGKFTLEAQEAGITFFEISNLFGVKILSSKVERNKMEINLSSQSSGIYFIRAVYRNGTSVTKKIMIQ